MNWKTWLALAVVVLVAFAGAILFPQCAAGRSLCTKWRCFPLCMLMGVISLGLAAVVALSGDSRKRKK
jgi:hypothetical protein